MQAYAINVNENSIRLFKDYWNENKNNYIQDAKDNGLMHLVCYDKYLFQKTLFREFDYERFNAGNYFSHEHPYYPHVDIFDYENTINIVVPLICEDPDQKLIVFDQTYKEKAATWCGYISKREFHGNPAIRKRMCDTSGVRGLTNKPCPDNLLEHLPYGSDFYYGLSGSVFDWKVGTAIVFNSYNIHCTGQMKPGITKVGCTSFLR